MPWTPAASIPLVGFLPFDDPRVVATIAAVQQQLGRDGLLLRYAEKDGLPGGEGAFLLCSFWLVDCLIGLNRLEDAEALLHRLEGVANHLGLFSEEYDVAGDEALGNFPQAFTHIGYINSVVALQQAKAARAFRLKPAREKRRPLMFFQKVLLNDGEPTQAISPDDMAIQLKFGHADDRGRPLVPVLEVFGPPSHGIFRPCSDHS